MSKIIIGIIKGEYYPVYQVIDPKEYHSNVEVDEETVARWNRVMDEFDEVQTEIAQTLEAQK